MAKPFIGLDGADKNGVRAEVWVQKGEGYVDQIKPPRSWKSSSGGDFDPNNTNELPSNVSIVIKNEYIREGVSGWVSVKDPIFDEALNAFNTKAEVSYRIEWQRNDNIDRSTPVKELRGYNEQTEKSDMGMCNKNGGNIFAGINNVVGREAVTDPAEDETGRRSALAQNNTAQSAQSSANVQSGHSIEDVDKAIERALKVGADANIVNVLAAESLLSGGTPTSVIYATNNNDSMTNSYSLIELSRKLLLKVASDAVDVETDNQIFQQTVAMAEVFASILDNVQVSYYNLPAANRGSVDYRILVDLLSNLVSTVLPVPFGGGDEDQANWNRALTDVVRSRFAMVCAVNNSKALLTHNSQASQVQPVNDKNNGDDEQGEHQKNASSVEDTSTVDNNQTGNSKPAIPTPGDKGYVVPSPEALQYFHSLAVQAGFSDNPDAMRTYINTKFNVASVKQVHGPVLDTLNDWLKSKQDPVTALKDLVYGSNH